MYNHGRWPQVWWEHAGGPHDGYLGEISGWTCPRPTSKDRRLWVLLGSKQSQPVNPNTPHPAREQPQPGWEPRNADTGHPRVRRLRTRRLPSRVSVRVGSARHGSPPRFTLPTPVVTSRAPLTSLAPPPSYAPTVRIAETLRRVWFSITLSSLPVRRSLSPKGLVRPSLGRNETLTEVGETTARGSHTHTHFNTQHAVLRHTQKKGTYVCTTWLYNSIRS